MTLIHVCHEAAAMIWVILRISDGVWILGRKLHTFSLHWVALGRNASGLFMSVPSMNVCTFTSAKLAPSLKVVTIDAVIRLAMMQEASCKSTDRTFFGASAPAWEGMCSSCYYISVKA